MTPEENCPPALKLTLILIQTLTLSEGQFFSGAIVRIPFRASILKSIWERLLLIMSMKLRKIKNCWDFNSTYSISVSSENVNLFAFISRLVSFRVCIYLNISLMWWEINSKLQTINIYSRVDKKKIKSCALNFD